MSDQDNKSISVEEQIHAILQLVNNKESSDDLAFQEAACVLVAFDPTLIRPFERVEISDQNDAKWNRLLDDCEPILDQTEGNWWQLKRTVRRRALKRLGSIEEMQKALNCNPARPQNMSQKLFDDVIFERSINIEKLKREELIILGTIYDWLKDIVDVSIGINKLKQVLPVADLLEPLRKMADSSFVGRKKELLELADYVGVVPSNSLYRNIKRYTNALIYDLTERPPLLIYGPGGVGKSTLIAKFILDHIEKAGSDPLPFVYLNVERPVLDLERPTTLLLEAAHQLSNQHSVLKPKFLEFKGILEASLSSFDELEVSKSYYANNMGDGSNSFAAELFGDIVRSIGTPIILIVDTFEEAQFLGNEVVREVWNLLVSMQRVAPNLRIVVSGRALIKEFPVRELLLKDFSEVEALEFLTNAFKDDKNGSTGSKAIFKTILNLVGFNPMSLRLASAIVREQGIDKLQSVDTRKWVIFKMRNEVVQARLYGRILAHIHDPEVKKLAYPGLIVRRITPSVIINVLAEPCRLGWLTVPGADSLFERLSKEVALVEPDPDDLVNRDPVVYALRHRQDVRRLMLKDLKEEVPGEVIRAIHDLAVDYYSNLDDDISRAEEIYHRLSRGDNPAEVDSRWRSSLNSRLRNSLEELPDKARIWLSAKLNVTPDSNLLERADLENWEEITAKAVQRHLQSGNPAAALKLLHERRERTPQSTLYRLELEALRMQGKFNEAVSVVDKALGSANSSGNVNVTRELLLQATFIYEAQGNIEAALDYVIGAEQTLPRQADSIEALRVYITHIRLLRKLGDLKNQERASLIEKSIKILNHESVQRSLFNHPALLREIVAELGNLMPTLVQNAMAKLGIDVHSVEQVNRLSQALLDWNSKLQENTRSGPGELVKRAGIKQNTLNDWASFINKNAGKKLNLTIQHWQSELSSVDPSNEFNINFNKSIVDIYRSSVDNSLKGGGD